MNFCLILCLFNVSEKEMESFKIIPTLKKSDHILNKLLLLCSIVVFMFLFDWKYLQKNFVAVYSFQFSAKQEIKTLFASTHKLINGFAIVSQLSTFEITKDPLV